jgi:nucleoside 2-deoxyribosyltransferase
MKVYVAHPAFTEPQRDFKAKFFAGLKDQLQRIENCRSVELVDPFDYSPNVENDIKEKVARAKEIRESCLNLLDRCELLIAVADGNDTGTAFEAGYAYRMNIPVILVSGESCDPSNAMLLGAAQARFDDVLDPIQLSLLAGLIEWHCLRLLGPRFMPIE